VILYSTSGTVDGVPIGAKMATRRYFEPSSNSPFDSYSINLQSGRSDLLGFCARPLLVVYFLKHNVFDLSSAVYMFWYFY
jgi:hypothetical protein